MATFLLLGLNSEKNLKMLSLELEKNINGLKIVMASDGLQFIQKTRKQQFPFLVAEENLSGVTNIELMTDLQNEKNNKNAQLLFLTHKEITMELRKSFENQKHIIHAFPKSTKEFIQLISDFTSGKLNQVASAIPPEPLKAVAEVNHEFSIQNNIINPFVHSTTKILKQFCKPESFRHFNPYCRIPEEKLGIVISGILQMEAKEFKGHLAISFNQESFLYLAHKFDFPAMKSVGIENQDLVANVIKKITELLNADLKNHEISLPVEKVFIMRGKDHFITQEELDKTIIIPIDIDSHRMYLQAVVKKK